MAVESGVRNYMQRRGARSFVSNSTKIEGDGSVVVFWLLGMYGQ
jgi:hypothetical protein